MWKEGTLILFLQKDGCDELILVTPDGLVYIINWLGEIVSYDIGEPIHLAHMGDYSIDTNAPNQSSTECPESTHYDQKSMISFLARTKRLGVEEAHISSLFVRRDFKNFHCLNI